MPHPPQAVAPFTPTVTQWNVLVDAFPTRGGNVAYAGFTCGDVGLLTVRNGSAAAPSIALVNSPTTGLYRSAADVLGIAVAGVARAVISADGIGLGTTTPIRALHLVRVGADETKNGIIFTDNSGGDYRTAITVNASGSAAASNKLNILVSNATVTGQTTVLQLLGSGHSILTFPPSTTDASLANQQGYFYAQSDTSIRLRYKGTDAVVREVTLTLA